MKCRVKACADWPKWCYFNPMHLSEMLEKIGCTNCGNEVEREWNVPLTMTIYLSNKGKVVWNSMRMKTNCHSSAQSISNPPQQKRQVAISKNPSYKHNWSLADFSCKMVKSLLHLFSLPVATFNFSQMNLTHLVKQSFLSYFVYE